MFSSNSVGLLYQTQSFDKFGQTVLGDPIQCPYSQVTLKAIADKTSVRADSSASRGSADEITADARVLIAKFISPKISDLMEIDNTMYRIVSVFPRKTVFGRLDHWECDLAIQP